jgi:hypothetical protein
MTYLPMIKLVAKYMSLTFCEISNVMNIYISALLINNSKTITRNSFVPGVQTISSQIKKGVTSSRVLVIADKEHRTPSSSQANTLLSIQPTNTPEAPTPCPTRGRWQR